MVGLLAAAAVVAALIGWYRRPRRLKWQLVRSTSGQRLLHAVAVVDGKMFVAGGCCGDRHLDAVHVFDLNTPDLTMSEASPCPIACAGHSLVARDKTLILLAAVPPNKRLQVYTYDTVGSRWSRVEATGDIPNATIGHSAILMGSRIVLFGGHTFSGRLLDRLHMLDLESYVWERVDASGLVPSRRAFHAVAARDEHTMLLFGGRTAAGVCNTLHALDVDTKCWSLCPFTSGVPTPRAYFGSSVNGDEWYIVGGGVRPDTVMLNMKTMEWSLVAVDPRLACEGLSLVHARPDTLVAMGSRLDDTEVREHVTTPQCHLFRLRLRNKPKKVLPWSGPGKCIVRDVGGLRLGIFEVPKGGTPASGIGDLLKEQTGLKGTLSREGVVLAGDVLVPPGDDLMFQGILVRGRHLRLLDLDKMDASTCRHFLRQLRVQVIRGHGWLAPSREVVEAEAFRCEDTTRRSWLEPSEDVEAAFRYLTEHGVELGRTFYSLYTHVNDERQEAEEVVSNALGFRLVYKVQIELRYSRHPAVGFWFDETVDEQSRWRALVLLLAMNMQGLYLAPWLVITDLKEQWELAWMNGLSMFVCKASSRGQALALVRDLISDYDKLTNPNVRGGFALPPVFHRVPLQLEWDPPYPRAYPELYNREVVAGGVHLINNLETVFLPDAEDEAVVPVSVKPDSEVEFITE